MGGWAWFERIPPPPRYKLDIKIQLDIQCSPTFGTVIFRNITIPTAGHRSVGFKKPTVVEFKNPTNPIFRVGLHALFFRVNRKDAI